VPGRTGLIVTMLGACEAVRSGMGLLRDRFFGDHPCLATEVQTRINVSIRSGVYICVYPTVTVLPDRTLSSPDELLPVDHGNGGPYRFTCLLDHSQHGFVFSITRHANFLLFEIDVERGDDICTDNDFRVTRAPWEQRQRHPLWSFAFVRTRVTAPEQPPQVIFRSSIS